LVHFFIPLKEMAVETIVGVVHLFIMVICGVFFLFPKSKFDLLFLLWMFGVTLSWTVFNGNCLFTYSVRYPEDTSLELLDVYRVFPASAEPNVKVGIKVLGALSMVSLVLVLLRNNLNIALMGAPFLIYYNLYALQNPMVNAFFFCIFATQVTVILKKILKRFF